MNKRLTFPTAAALGAALLPLAALAQTDAGTVDNASGTIGLLVAWLLVGGGILSIAICVSVDRNLRSKR